MAPGRWSRLSRARDPGPTVKNWCAKSPREGGRLGSVDGVGGARELIRWRAHRSQPPLVSARIGRRIGTQSVACLDEFLLCEAERIAGKCRPKRQIRAHRVERAPLESLLRPKINGIGFVISIGIGAIERKSVDAVRMSWTHSLKSDHAIRIGSEPDRLLRVQSCHRGGAHRHCLPEQPLRPTRIEFDCPAPETANMRSGRTPADPI